SDPDSAIETVGWNATVRCKIGSSRPGRVRAPSSSVPAKQRPVYFSSVGWTDATVHRLEALREADSVVGPAIVESDFTSIVIDPDIHARRDAMGTLVVDISE
ncbi:MAG: hydantoinase/oxoprolinase family protein, partial [Alphaproteobacteria bacterium]